AKNLGEVAMWTFCPRCFWIKRQLNNKLPFQIFPGIFSSIDSYTKRVVHGWFDKYGSPPPWLGDLGNLVGYIEPPHYSKYNIVDQENNILLTGSPDGVFIRPDNSHIIVDYKTAKYTGAQDMLYPMYETQLNAYAMIGNKCGLDPVSDLALIYMEPVTDEVAAAGDENYRGDGFGMSFAANIHKVKLDINIIPALLSKTREINDLNSLPDGREGCRDCQQLEDLLGVIEH
ncbi:hypothetical protein ACFLX7_05560, partial [Chloroflexota bacterium]